MSNDDNCIRQPSLFDLGFDQEKKDEKIQLVDDNTKERIFTSLMALKTIKGVGFKTLCSIFDDKLLLDIWNLRKEEISLRWSSSTIKNKNDFIDTFISSRKTLFDKGNESVDELRKKQIEFIPIGHRLYPESLLRLIKPPRWIFVKGNIELLQSKSIVGVVGTRNPSNDGQRLSYLCAGQLATRNLVVLSGLAKGIDESAHLGAVDYLGQTIAVLGNGLLVREVNWNSVLLTRILGVDGSVISEYMPFDPPSKQSFLRRNELQAALSRLVIPVECPSLESGTGATIRRALNLKTPLIGISAKTNGINENLLASTKKNLSKIGILSLPILNENSELFWDYLKKVFPEHNWNFDPTSRQERLFNLIERQILIARKRVHLDEQSIDRLAERLKKILSQ